MTYHLGIDIGAGGSRALLVDPSGEVVAGVTRVGNRRGTACRALPESQ